MKHFGVLDRFVCRGLFSFFLLCLENIDEAHRTALAARIRHLGEKLFLVNIACRSPRRLDILDIFSARLVDYIAPVERHFFPYRFFLSRSCLDCFLRFLRLRNLDVRESSEFRLRSGYPSSAFAAELGAIDKRASTISTEHYYLRIVYCPQRAVLPFFAR